MPAKPKRRAVLKEAGMTGPIRTSDAHPNQQQTPKAWWSQREGKYPFKAEAQAGVVPHEEIESGRYGNCASVVLKTGVRTWGFDTEAGRDLFVEDLAHRRARILAP